MKLSNQNDDMLATSETPTTEVPKRVLSRSISEALILGICLIAPWLFGAVDAWAELILCFLIVVVSLVGMIQHRDAKSIRLSIPSLAITGLFVYGIAQQTAIPQLRTYLSTYQYAGKTLTLFPVESEQVLGENSRPVKLPKASVSIYPEGTRQAVARLAGGWLLFESVARLDSPYFMLRRFGLMTVVNSCLLSVFSMVQWLTWNGKIYRLRLSPHPDLAWYAGGPFICHNHLAAYLNIGFGFSVGLILATFKGDPLFGRDRGQRLWPVLIAGVVLTGLVVSHSRGGLLAALASMVLLLATQRFRLGWSALAFVFLALAAVLALMATGSDTPWARLATLSTATKDVRWEVWRVAFKAWVQRPCLGYGLGSFGSAVSPFTDKEAHAIYQRAENQYFDLLVEGGVVGLALGLTAIGFTIINGRRAIERTRVVYERLFVIGGFFGGIGLLLHWMTDFSFHIPGVAVSVVVLSALLCRLGLEHGGSWALELRWWPLRFLAVVVAPLLLCAMILVPATRNARVEVALWRAGLPLPDTLAPTPALPNHTPGDLREQIETYDYALSLRPDWLEGYLRRGLAYLELYQVTAALWLKESNHDLDETQLALLSDPLWLRAQLIERSKSNDGGSSPAISPLDQEPVVKFLIPAAQSFLEARRACKFSALANAELTSLHYLLKTPDPSTRYLERLIALAGADATLLVIGGKIAYQDGDPDTMVVCFRRALEVNPEVWQPVAGASLLTLSVDRILSEVIPPDQGHLALYFAEGFRNTTRKAREALLKGALEMIPRDVTMTPAEIDYYLALTHYGLGEIKEAIPALTSSLRLDPRNTDRRLRLIQWLANSNAWKEAKLQANIGLQFEPNNPKLLDWQRITIERVAYGLHSSSSDSEP